MQIAQWAHMHHFLSVMDGDTKLLDFLCFRVHVSLGQPQPMHPSNNKVCLQLLLHVLIDKWPFFQEIQMSVLHKFNYDIVHTVWLLWNFLCFIEAM